MSHSMISAQTAVKTGSMRPVWNGLDRPAAGWSCKGPGVPNGM